MKHVQQHVYKLTNDRASGYGTTYMLPVFATVTIIVLGVSAIHLQWLGLVHVILLTKLVLLLVAYELLRPFCLSFKGAVTLMAHVGSAASAAVLQFVKRGLHPKFPEWTFWYEWFQAIAFAAGQQNGSHILKMPNVLAFRRNFELIGRLLGAWACWCHDNKLESFQYNGLEHLWLRSQSCSKKTESERRIVVLYYHGGGYALFSPHFFVEFASRLLSQVQSQLRSFCKDTDDSTSIDVQLLLANYRKLPEVCFPAPLDDAMAMFDYLVKHEKIPPHNIILAGDSAGGGLVIATLLRLRRSRREMPLAALCSCPYADLSADVAVSEHCFISKSMLDAIRNLCEQTPRSLWREGAMLQTDLSGLPPLFIQAAEFDILHQQSLQLAKNARSHGVNVELDVHEHMPHVFTLFPHFIMPQSSVGIERLAAFVLRQITAHRVPVQLPMAAAAF